MPFVIMPIQNNSDRQQKDDSEFSARADSGILLPAGSKQHSPRIKNSSPYENRALLPLTQLQSHTLPMTPMPRQLPEVPNRLRDSQTSNSNTPPKSTSATDRGKVDHFATKIKE